MPGKQVRNEEKNYWDKPYWEEVFLGFYRWWDMDGKWYKDVWWRLNARQAGKVNFPKVYFC